MPVNRSTFTDFVRAWPKTASPSARRNLGLGLFIVREIAPAHGGDVTVAMTGPRIAFRILLPKTEQAG